MKLYGIKRADDLWYIGTADKKPVFGKASGRAQFNEDIADKRIKGLRSKGHEVKKVLTRVESSPDATPPG